MSTIVLHCLIYFLLLIFHLLAFGVECHELRRYSTNDAVNDGEEVIVIVRTSTATIRGKTKQIDVGGNAPDEKQRASINVFFGIPYAQPPIGQLRFEKTQPLPTTKADQERVVDAFELPWVCVPHHRLDNWTWDWHEYSEDCLHMNVFAPAAQNTSLPPKLFPTLLIVHSGGFETQSMRRYKDYEDIGRKYVTRGIVVIAVQFRIGYFGFSSAGDEQFAGNYGYWDLTEALRWIHKNAAAFGGDPERLTLFGYSSGSSIVTTLAIAPETRELFQQVVQMSGPVFTSRAASTRPIQITRRLAILLGCNAGTTAKAIKTCMKGKSIDQFMAAMDTIGPTFPDLNYDLFGPVMDGDFLPADFPDLIRATRPKPTMLGTNELEPLGYTLINGNNSLRHLAIPRAEFDQFGAEQFRLYLSVKLIKSEYFGDEQRRQQLLDEVQQFYLAQRPQDTVVEDNWFYLERICELLADLQFIVPFVWEVRAKHDWPLFQYVFKYANPKRFPAHVKIHKSFHDVDHFYVFRHPYSSYVYDEEDKKMEALMSDFLANFIINGNPSSTTRQWPAANQSMPFLHLDISLSGTPQIADLNNLDRVQFWERMVNRFPEYNLVLGRAEDGKGEQQNAAATTQTSTQKFAAIVVGGLLAATITICGHFCHYWFQIVKIEKCPHTL